MSASTVAVLLIDHKHGTDISVHRDETAARRALFGYVQTWWAQEIGTEPMPDDRDEAIEAYFAELVERTPSEDYRIETHAVSG